MRIQEQLPWDQVNDETLSFFKAISVDYLTIYPTFDLRDGQDRTDYWQKMQRLAETHGLKLNNVATNCWDEITLGLPDRDEKIEAWCTILRNLGQAGIPTMGYNFKPVGNFRTTSTTGRGGALYSSFDFEEFSRNPPHYPDKEISEVQLWENLEYFLQRVIPVAEEAGVQMALHPDDPPIPEPMGARRGLCRPWSSIIVSFRWRPAMPTPCSFARGAWPRWGKTYVRRFGTLGL
jgi:D-mannonate dehydratase